MPPSITAPAKSIAVQLIQGPVFYGLALLGCKMLATPVMLRNFSAPAAKYAGLSSPAGEGPSNLSVAGESHIQNPLRARTTNPELEPNLWWFSSAQPDKFALPRIQRPSSVPEINCSHATRRPIACRHHYAAFRSHPVATNGPAEDTPLPKNHSRHRRPCAPKTNPQAIRIEQKLTAA